ncbi:MAG TPA: LysM peptidoglycan-binding domain-containing protein [Anaerolineales bacterium]|nr:LysM peptidoglycan-binding domain-containing protein [Anaerolineales bacterium]
MKIRFVAVLSLFLIALLCFGLSLRAQAAPAQQQFATNTALPDGRILYTVQAGDTCGRIQLLYGISLQQLRELNENINSDCTNLIPGQNLLIALSGPAGPSATPGPSPTLPPPTTTPTPFAGTTEICVLLYDDLNGNALREATEPAVAGGAISVAETSGKYSKTLQTAINPDPNAYQGVCFTDVPEGNYNIGVAIPDNYNPTTNLTYTLDVKAGDRAEVSFGAQSRDTGVAAPSGGGPSGGGTSPILGFFGAILLLGGIGLGWYALRLRGPQSKLKRSGLAKR